MDNGAARFRIRFWLCLFLGLVTWVQLEAQFGPEQIISYTEVGNPADGSVVDVDEDGLLDVIVASFWPDNRLVWYRNLGGGSFGQAHLMNATLSGVQSTRVADFDGDGFEDVLVCGNYVGGLCWLKNAGVNEWELNAIDATIDFQLNYSEDVIAIADIDLDGDIDVTIGAITYPNADPVLGWYANDGEGGFGSLDTIAAPTFQYYNDLVATDVDNDGDVDLMAVSDSVRWFENDGSAAFTLIHTLTEVAPPIGTDHARIQAMLLDSDDAVDLIFVANGALTALLNDGAGNFTILTGFPFASNELCRIAAVDMDQDTDLDIALGHTNSGWFENDLNGSGVILDNLHPFQHTDARAWVDIDNDGDVDVLNVDHNFARHATWLERLDMDTYRWHDISSNVDDPRRVEFALIDDDSIADVVTYTGQGARLVWQKGNGDGTYGRPVLMDANWAGEEDIYYGFDFDIGDLDGDGDNDIVARSDDYYWTVMNDGFGTFGEKHIFDYGTGYAVRLGDIDGDSDLDIIVQINIVGSIGLGWLANDGSGSFGTPTELIHFGDGGYGGDIEIVDFDGDNDLDVIVSDGYSGNLVVMVRNQGAGLFAPREVLETFSLGNIRVRVADIDLDGNMDMVCSGSSDETIHWWRWDGVSFSEHEQVPFTLPNYVELADLDGDGRSEMIVSDGYSLEVFHLNADTVLVPWFPIEEGSSIITDVCPSDVDSDGDLDLVLAKQDTPDRFSWRESYFHGATSISGMVFIDVDNDGERDSLEVGAAWVPVQTDPPAVSWFTGDTGAFMAYVDTGACTVSYSVVGPQWELSTDPSSYDLLLTGADSSATDIDFGLHAVADVSDIVADITLGVGACGAPIPIWLDYRNEGTRIEQGILDFQHGLLYDFISATPAPVSTDLLSAQWTFDSLNYFAHRTVNVVALAPPVQDLGEAFSLTFVVERTDSLGTVTDTFTTNYQGEVTCAYDPNDKLVDPKGYGVHGAVDIAQDRLDYTIRFQNTGNDTAANVLITDVLSDQLDHTSVQVLSTSHTMTQMSVGADGEVQFRYDDIDLPDSAASRITSQGFVKFRARPLLAITHGTVVQNTANIYFDLNAAIVTNTVRNTFIDCGLHTASITNDGSGTLAASQGEAYQWSLNGDSISGAVGPYWIVGELGEYTVRVTSEFGCVALSPVVEIDQLGVGEWPQVECAVYPNPANTDIRLVSNEVLGAGCELQLVDCDGRVVRAQRGSGTRELVIGHSGLHPGLYVLRLQLPDMRVVTTRIVIE